MVLFWLNSSSCNYKSFVSTRIQEFQDSHPNWREEVRYIASEENPADCLTKFVSIEDLASWIGGGYCSFLREPEERWPDNKRIDDVKDKWKSLIEENNPPTKRIKAKKYNKGKGVEGTVLHVNVVNVEVSTLLVDNFPTWEEAVYAISYMNQIIEARSFKKIFLYSPDNFQKAEMSFLS